MTVTKSVGRTASEGYHPLDVISIVAYVRSRPELQAVFHADEPLDCIEVGDGNLNLVFKVTARSDPRRSVVLKQALPYVRLVGESWPLTPDRARIEAQALAIGNQLAPEHTPHLYFYDSDQYLIAMQNLDPHIIMRQGLMQGITYPHFAHHIGVYLARVLGNTSDFVLDYRTKKEEVARFINPELCKISEDLIFTEPYRQHHQNSYHLELEPYVLALQADEALRAEVAQLKDQFMTQAQALLHGDLHTGSIMVSQTDTYVIDAEFAFYGPMGFDIGAVIGNLLLSYASHEVRTTDEDQRAAFRKYLTDTIIQLWHIFEQEFQRLIWSNVDPISYPPAFQQRYLRQVLRDSAGFAGTKMIRRIIGLAGVADIRGIEDVGARTIAATLALNIGAALIRERQRIDTIEAVVEIAAGCRPSAPKII
ncbi:MAG: S-methyl-5-thioribose kinase [Anaerolineae bacterium]|nr:S-methyl-5-thioribose kinase [Anaerolineae bacterium]